MKRRDSVDPGQDGRSGALRVGVGECRLLGLLLVVGPWLACTTPAPGPEPLPEPVKTYEDLRRDYLERINEIERVVERTEARRDEIVATRLADREVLRERHRLQLAEVERRLDSLGLLDRQLADRRGRIAEIRRDSEEGGSARALIDPLEEEIDQLAADREHETSELERAQAKVAEIAAELGRLEGFDEDALFLDEMRPLYSEGIELHLEFYREMLDIARLRLAEEKDAAAVIERFEERVARREGLSQPLRPDEFEALSREKELDVRFGQALLFAYIVEVRFDLGEYTLESLSHAEHRELELAAESLAEIWSSDERMVMFIDGHADSRRFRDETECRSATRNRELSRQRAEAVSDFFLARLGGAPERIRVDWFGNFSLRTEAREAGELENRRIELRVATARGDGYGSHPDYFALRAGLVLGASTFLRRPGEWVDLACRDRPVARELEYLGRDQQELAVRLGIDGATTVSLAGGREVEVRLGNAFVVEADGHCVRVRPCAEE